MLDQSVHTVTLLNEIFPLPSKIMVSERFVSKNESAGCKENCSGICGGASL